MPEAPVDEDHCAIPGEDEIGGSRQSTVMQTEPQAGGMKIAAHELLRLGVLASDRRHLFERVSASTMSVTATPC
jgi:hypothetical protein